MPGHGKRETGQTCCEKRRRCSLLRNGRVERSREKDRKKRRRSLRRFFKKVRLRRNRRKRAACLLVLSAAVVYLMIIGAYRDLFLSVKEFRETGAVLERGAETDDVIMDVFRISIRLKNGEILFYRERTEKSGKTIDNDRP